MNRCTTLQDPPWPWAPYLNRHTKRGLISFQDEIAAARLSFSYELPSRIPTHNCLFWISHKNVSFLLYLLLPVQAWFLSPRPLTVFTSVTPCSLSWGEKTGDNVSTLYSQVHCLHVSVCTLWLPPAMAFFFLLLLVIIINSLCFILLGVPASRYTGPALFALPCRLWSCFINMTLKTHVNACRYSDILFFHVLTRMWGVAAHSLSCFFLISCKASCVRSALDILTNEAPPATASY